MNYQYTCIVGNVGRDAEMRYTPAGQGVTSFSVAANRQWTNSAGEKVRETTWFRVSAWGKLAETCSQYVKKGQCVLVAGRLTPDPETGGPRIWTDKEGNAHASYELTAQVVQFPPAQAKPDGDGFGDVVVEPSGISQDEEMPF